MIDARLEQLITLDQAAEFAPGYRPNRCASVAAVRRWAKDGMRGCRRCTSREAVQRFFEALTKAREPKPPRTRPRPPLTSADVRLALRERHGLL